MDPGPDALLHPNLNQIPPVAELAGNTEEQLIDK